MEKEKFMEGLDALRKDAEEIRGSLLPKSITPEMVGGTLSGIVDSLKDLTQGAPGLVAADEEARERISKTLFIKMWNEAAGKFGKYNEETDLFELNGLTDISYEEALVIYFFGRDYCTGVHNKEIRDKIRTNLFTLESHMSVWYNDLLFNDFSSLGKIEVIRLAQKDTHLARLKYAGMINMFSGCSALREVIGILDVYDNAGALIQMNTLPSLEEIRVKNMKGPVRFRESSKLSLASVRYLVENAVTPGSYIIEVHPDVYAKLTDDHSNEAVQKTPPEELAQWIQLLSDAAKKNISFATS